MSEATQHTLFGGELETTVELEADGRVIRPFKRLLDPVADEYRLHFESDGISVEVVDASNVIMTRAHLDAEAFESYTVSEETTIGVSGRAFGNVLQHARYGKSTSDSIEIRVDPKEMQSTVEKEIVDTAATIGERAETINPNSVRAEPDVPDLTFEYDCTLPANTLSGVLDVFELKSKRYIEVETTGSGVRFSQGEDEGGRVVELDVDAGEAGEGTIYTGSYMADVQTQLQNGLIDTATVKWGDDFPIIVEMEREGVYDATSMVAPRIGPD